MPKLIVVGTDNSPRAQTAVDHAADLAEAFDAKLRIVTVHRVLPPAYAVSQYTLFPLWSEQDDGDALAGHLAYLEPVAKRLRARGLRVEVELVTGDPATVIIKSAEKAGADMIVIGDRGLRGARRFFHSVAKAIITSATVPVLVVPTGDATD
jgi:nucleotide-binding universal stress UspA family protein